MHDAIPLTLAQFAEPEVPPQEGAAASSQQGAIPKGEGATTTEPGNQPLPGSQESQGTPFGSMIFFVVIMGVLFFVLMGGQRREKKRRKKLLASVKKGDKVQTVGGILGTIVELRETEVLLKVDENTNTRIKFGRSSIQSVIADRQEE